MEEKSYIITNIKIPKTGLTKTGLTKGDSSARFLIFFLNIIIQ